MKQTFKIIALFGLIALFSNCRREPAFDATAISHEKVAEYALKDGETIEVIIVSANQVNVSEAQPLYCDCVSETVRSQKCVRYGKEDGASVCVEWEDIWVTQITCPNLCDSVNVFNSIAPLMNRKGKFDLVEIPFLLPKGVILQNEYKETQLSDGRIVPTVQIEITNKKQLDQKNSQQPFFAILKPRA